MINMYFVIRIWFILWTVFTGVIRCIAISPDGTWIAIGFSTGVISVLNLYTGMLLGSWKAHDNEILQVGKSSIYNKIKPKW